MMTISLLAQWSNGEECFVHLDDPIEDYYIAVDGPTVRLVHGDGSQTVLECTQLVEGRPNAQKPVVGRFDKGETE